MKTKIQLLIVDDHMLFRESLSRLLEADTDYEVAGTCGSVQQALAILDRMPIDIVLLDYDLREESGIQFLQEHMRRPTPCRVLMLTSGMTEPDVVRAMKGGASGIFLKNSPMAELAQALRRVKDGESWLDPGVVGMLVASVGERQGEEPEDALSSRESSVLRYVFEGLSNKEIAQQLSISEGSVKAVLQQLFARTGVRTRSQLVRIAVEKHSKEWLKSD